MGTWLTCKERLGETVRAGFCSGSGGQGATRGRCPPTSLSPPGARAGHPLLAGGSSMADLVTPPYITP